MKKYLTLLLVVAGLQLSAQQFSSADPNYITNVKAGEAALNDMKYDSCLVYYKQAFKIKQTSILSTLRAAACGHSLDDVAYRDKQLDTAFDLDWGNSKGIFTSYPEFKYLMGTEFENIINDRWEDAAEEAGVNLELMLELEKIGETDQVYRRQMRSTSETYGHDSPQMDSLWVLQNHADSVNTLRITEIIAEYGYPGKSLVGGEASTAFMVIQHADLEVQEKYVDIIKEAANNEEIRWSSVALLVDRINTRNERPQKYGTQLGTDQETREMYFFEIEQPFKIDSVRATVGLGPLQSYADNWDYTFDPEVHIEKAKARNAVKAAKKLEEEKEKKN